MTGEMNDDDKALHFKRIFFKFIPLRYLLSNFGDDEQ